MEQIDVCVVVGVSIPFGLLMSCHILAWRGKKKGLCWRHPSVFCEWQGPGGPLRPAIGLLSIPFPPTRPRQAQPNSVPSTTHHIFILLSSLLVAWHLIGPGISVGFEILSLFAPSHFFFLFFFFAHHNRFWSSIPRKAFLFFLLLFFKLQNSTALIEYRLHFHFFLSSENWRNFCKSGEYKRGSFLKIGFLFIFFKDTNE